LLRPGRAPVSSHSGAYPPLPLADLSRPRSHLLPSDLLLPFILPSLPPYPAPCPPTTARSRVAPSPAPATVSSWRTSGPSTPACACRPACCCPSWRTTALSAIPCWLWPCLAMCVPTCAATLPRHRPPCLHTAPRNDSAQVPAGRHAPLASLPYCPCTRTSPCSRLV
jgi:hypothetical protein